MTPLISDIDPTATITKRQVVTEADEAVYRHIAVFYPEQDPACRSSRLKYDPG